jgi:hypothetical protein
MMLELRYYSSNLDLLYFNCFRFVAILLKQYFKRRHIMSINKKLIVISTALVLSFSTVNSVFAAPEHRIALTTQHVSIDQPSSASTGNLPDFLADTGAKSMSNEAMQEVHGEFLDITGDNATIHIHGDAIETINAVAEGYKVIKGYLF